MNGNSALLKETFRGHYHSLFLLHEDHTEGGLCTNQAADSPDTASTVALILDFLEASRTVTSKCLLFKIPCTLLQQPKLTKAFTHHRRAHKVSHERKSQHVGIYFF